MPNPAPSQNSLYQTGTPRLTRLQVIPVAGCDGMLLNLSGAHSPFFTRNLVLLSDSSGRTGLGEVPGGEKIRQTLEGAGDLLLGEKSATTTRSCAMFEAALRTATAAGAATRPLT